MVKTSAVISIALAGAMMLPAISAAQAGPRNNTYIENNIYNNTYVKRHHRHKSKKKGVKPGEAAAIGVIGLAAGLLIGNAISAPAPAYHPPAPAYRPPAPAYRPPAVAHRAPPVYRAPVAAPAPWSPAWFAYCTNKYRSFNPNTGTFRTYSGKDRFCQ
ncbi:BA14K-like protein [Pseudovibrio axinellae]|uniref:Lectin-like protein BA14k n=1 Tax=Pseudovibrio axinellae TaxID=989403 RepID=A0A166AT94_9HYPH|nr:BA14K family protein [Pseudovibrio axinellae]KZL21521.1 BA14K-like protein [Pseudovibrio axinellae]SER08076.1 BA14K-like protein [Pseudovibrio axinellae]